MQSAVWWDDNFRPVTGWKMGWRITLAPSPLQFIERGGRTEKRRGSFDKFSMKATMVLIGNGTRIESYWVKYDFSAWPGRGLQCCSTQDSLCSKRYWLEVSKMVKHDLVPQGASEFWDVKAGSYWKLNFYVVNEILQTLTDYNSDAPWGTRSCFTFL